MTEATIDVKPDETIPAGGEPEITSEPDKTAGIASEATNKEAEKDKGFDLADFKLPEGSDEQAVSEIVAWAKAQGFGQEQAQALLTRELEAAVDEKSNPENWVNQAREDKEIGGDNFKANIEIARQGVEHFSNPELKRFLTESGAGNHPEIIRVFYRIGKSLQSDNFINGAAAVRGDKSAEEIFYD